MPTSNNESSRSIPTRAGRLAVHIERRLRRQHHHYYNQAHRADIFINRASPYATQESSSDEEERLNSNPRRAYEEQSTYGDYISLMRNLRIEQANRDTGEHEEEDEIRTPLRPQFATDPFWQETRQDTASQTAWPAGRVSRRGIPASRLQSEWEVLVSAGPTRPEIESGSDIDENEYVTITYHQVCTWRTQLHRGINGRPSAFDAYGYEDPNFPTMNEFSGPELFHDERFGSWRRAWFVQSTEELMEQLREADWALANYTMDESRGTPVPDGHSDSFDGEDSRHWRVEGYEDDYVEGYDDDDYRYLNQGEATQEPQDRGLDGNADLDMDIDDQDNDPDYEPRTEEEEYEDCSEEEADVNDAHDDEGHWSSDEIQEGDESVEDALNRRFGL
ncbi:hypothetical protein ABW20_dc0103036 [Dactylellina cionopaga]|nr:hypothetical protein ABW20_dc0103036 [Dactylellina cionopaga]